MAANCIANDPGMPDLFRRTMAEGARVAQAVGVEVSVDAEARFARMEQAQPPLLDAAGSARGAAAGNRRAARGGARRARRFDVPTPTFDVLLTLLVRRAREAGLYPPEPVAQVA